MSVNIKLQDREALLITLGLGLLAVDAAARQNRGEDTRIGGEEVSTVEVIEIITALRNNHVADEREAEPVREETPDVLTNQEKFVLSGAIGAMLTQLEEGTNRERSEAMEDLLSSAIKKLNLLPGAAYGVKEFAERFA